MNCELSDIIKVCGKIPGGLKEVAVIDPADVIGLPKQYCIPKIGEVLLKSAARSYVWQFEPHTARLTDKVVMGSVAGDYYEYALTFSVSGVRLDVEHLRARLRDRRVHVIATYRNGLRRFVPNVRAISDSDSGSRIADRNGYSFQGTARLRNPAPLLNGTLSNGTLITTQTGHLVLVDQTGGKWMLTTNNVGSLITVPVTTGDGVNYYPVNNFQMAANGNGTLYTE